MDKYDFYYIFFDRTGNEAIRTHGILAECCMNDLIAYASTLCLFQHFYDIFSSQTRFQIYTYSGSEHPEEGLLNRKKASNRPDKLKIGLNGPYRRQIHRNRLNKLQIDLDRPNRL